jgi:hypothetical protein
MRRAVSHLVGPGCFSALLVIVYHPVLFGDGQFAYRDAAGHYYPLYLRVQQEWDAGHLPLWDPGQNGGTPLLGNAMAAVLYPGKVLYALLPYAWAARLYVIAHTILAFLGVLALGRTCGLSWAGSYVAGLSYAFGAQILCQYGCVNMLVGSAWIPWGLGAIDGLLRQGRLRGRAELAVVLALQVLGGDPEAAYLTAVCGAGYAFVLAIRASDRPTPILIWSGALGAVGLFWVGATLGLAYARFAPPRFLVMNGVVFALWVAVGTGIAWGWHRQPGEARLAPLLARLAGASILAMALAAVQVLPALEFVGMSRRVSGDRAIDIYRSSLDPFRLVELVWPNVFGLPCPENRSWLQAIPPAGGHELWVDSIYTGGLTLVLGLSACGLRSRPPWRAWLTIVGLVGLIGSLGKYGSPLWGVRFGPFAASLGPHDPVLGQPRLDPFLDDGAGSPYGILAMLLPGFGAFRYPSKLVTFFSVALAVLAGAGWDRVIKGETRCLRRLCWVGLVSSLVGLSISLAVRDLAVAWLAGRVPPDESLGPADIAGAWAETQRALAHGVTIFMLILALVRWAPRRPELSSALALLLLSADLVLANARLIWTVPQAEFEAPLEGARLIQAAESSDPIPGPFRVYRMPSWYPIRFSTMHSAQHFREVLGWERTTLHPLSALPLGLAYCKTLIGAWELDEYNAFFRPRMMPIPAGVARVLGIPAGSPVVYFPRRSFDLWGVRYFLLPALPAWASPGRGFASFLDKTELVYPSFDVLHERVGRGGEEPWAVGHDWQLRRNRAAYPRAWIVHSARLRTPAADPDTRARWLGTLTYMNDPIWTERDRPVLDLRQMALIEIDDKESLKGFLPSTPTGPSESVAIVKYEPQRVELKAALDRPGLVILADTYYPGWRLRIDGKPAPILRANRLMRGAVVPAGEHTLVYTYQPASFWIGAMISMAGLIVLLVLTWSSWQATAASPWPPLSSERQVIPEA